MADEELPSSDAPPASLLYSLIARDGNVLAEYTKEIGNFQSVSRILLSRVPQQTPSSQAVRISYLYDDYMFHHYFKDAFCFIVLTPRRVNLRIPYLFLLDIANEVQSKFPTYKLQSTFALALSELIQPLLRERMDFWNRFISSGGISPELAKVQAQIADIHDVMVDNIDKILARNEKIGLLVDQSQELHNSAVTFRRQAQQYHRSLRWNSMRRGFIIAAVILFCLLILGMHACGGATFPHCRIR